MPTKTEFAQKQYPFASAGVALDTDPSALQDGQYQSQVNVVTVQEGALQVRKGGPSLSAAAGTSPANTIGKQRISNNEALNVWYVAGGGNIARSNAGIGTFTNINASPVTLSPYTDRCSIVPYAAGPSGIPITYVASPLAMLRDAPASPIASPPAFTNAALQPWAPNPPTRTPSLAVITMASTAASLTLSPALPYAFPAGGYWFLQLFTGAVDFSVLSGPVQSGNPANGYSNEDVVLLTFTTTDYPAFKQLFLYVNVGGSYVAGNVYSIELVPQDATLVDSTVTVGSSTTVTYALPKNKFVAWGSAGQAGHGNINWSTVNKISLFGISNTSATLATVTAVTTLQLQGGAGPNNDGPGMFAYRYLFTFRDPLTGQETNSSTFMTDDFGVYVHRQGVAVTCYGTDAPSIPVGTPQTIVVYRSGGSFNDSVYRRVGYATNPGVDVGTGDPTAVVFNDYSSDNVISSASTVETDNYPPVLSGLPTPYTATISTALTANTWTTVTLSKALPGVSAGPVFAPGAVNVGCRAFLTNGVNGTVEDVYIRSVASTTTIKIITQYDHAASALTIEIDAAANTPCRYASQIGTYIVLSGDPNNPHYIYSSKPSMPGSFPTTMRAEVGSPANPIYGHTDFMGDTLVFTPQNLYILRRTDGVWGEPYETAARTGLYTPNAWCKGHYQIFYLGYDGIYVFAGGDAQKISGQIDPMFRGQTINGVTPIDMTSAGKPYFSLEYFQSQLRVICRNTAGHTIMLRCDTAHGARWDIDSYNQDSTTNGVPVRLFADKDQGRLICSKTGATLSSIEALEEIGTSGSSDGYTTAPGINGLAINYSFLTKAFLPAGRAIESLATDIEIELECTESCTLSLYYDYSSTADSVDQFTIAGAAGVRRLAFPLQYNAGITSAPGKMMYAFAVGISGSATGRARFISTTLTSAPIGAAQRGRVTDWEDRGYPYDKRFKEITLEYDLRDLNNSLGQLTRNVYMDILYGIGGSLQQLAVCTFALTSVGTGRTKVTLPIVSTVSGFTEDLVVAKAVRLRPAVTSQVESILFQVVDYDFAFEKLPPDVIAFTEYSDLGYPYKKRIKGLKMSVDTGGVAATVSLQCDGATVTPPSTFSINTTALAKNVELTWPQDVLGNEIRIKAVPGAGGKFQLFGDVTWDYEKLPEQKTYFTALTSCNAAGDKLFKWINLSVDTGGIPAAVYIEGDGTNIYNFPAITTTEFNKAVTLTMASDFIANEVRLIATPGGGGKFQLFGDPVYSFHLEPPPILRWDSYEQHFGNAGWKFLKQMWIQYACDNVLVVQVYVDNDQLLYSAVLPAHIHRDTERFYLPVANGMVRNRSKNYRIVLSQPDGVNVFKLYRDGSRCEVLMNSKDQRSSAYQNILWTDMPAGSN